MEFKQSCFVHIKDMDKRKELIRWLEGIGYHINLSHDIREEWMVVVNDDNIDIFGVYACLDSPSFIGRKRAIDCGENIELFKALAAMNDQNDREQWFTDGNRWYKIATKKAHPDYAPLHYHKATTEEIIDYYKNQK